MDVKFGGGPLKGLIADYPGSKVAKKSYPWTNHETSYEKILLFLAEQDFINLNINILKNYGFLFKISLIEEKKLYFEFHHETLPTINSGLNINIASSIETFETMFKLVNILRKKIDDYSEY